MPPRRVLTPLAGSSACRRRRPTASLGARYRRAFASKYQQEEQSSRDKKSTARQKSEVRGQKSEVRSQTVYFLTSDLSLLISAAATEKVPLFRGQSDDRQAKHAATRRKHGVRPFRHQDAAFVGCLRREGKALSRHADGCAAAQESA